MPDQQDTLSRRERQILQILYRAGEASVNEVQESLSDAPGYSAVRALLGILVDKGLVKYRQDGRKYVYSPKVAAEKASRSALSSLVETFFSGSPTNAVATLLDMSEKMSEEDLDRLSRLIEKAREEGK